MLPVTSGVGAALTSSVLEPGCAPARSVLHRGAGQVAQAQQAAFQIVDVHGIAGSQHGQSRRNTASLTRDRLSSWISSYTPSCTAMSTTPSRISCGGR